MKINSFNNNRSLLVVALIFLSSVITSISYVQADEVEPPSPDFQREFEESLRECYENFVGHENTFLRGVKEENFITYNRSTFGSCQRHCCTEKQFNCSSFSFFAPLGVCYVMNLTKYDDDVRLEPFPGWKHYHKEFLIEISGNDTENLEQNSTDKSATEASINAFVPLLISLTSSRKSDGNKSEESSEDETATPQNEIFSAVATTSSSKDDVSLNLTSASTNIVGVQATDEVDLAHITTSENSNKTGTLNNLFNGKLDTLERDPEHMLLAANVQTECSGLCQNNGKCLLVEDEMQQETTICECKEGFVGKYCETESNVNATGLPPHIIAIAVIGILIFILFATLLVIAVFNKHKTGKYRLKLRRDQWLKKSKKNQTKRSNSFVSDMPQPPFDEKIPSASLFDTMSSRSVKSSV